MLYRRAVSWRDVSIFSRNNSDVISVYNSRQSLITIKILEFLRPDFIFTVYNDCLHNLSDANDRIRDSKIFTSTHLYIRYDAV